MSQQEGSRWLEHGGLEACSPGSQPVAISPSTRRNFYEAASTPAHATGLHTEMLSVREETAHLSSRALKEGIASPNLSPKYSDSPKLTPIQSPDPLSERSGLLGPSSGGPQSAARLNHARSYENRLNEFSFGKAGNNANQPKSSLKEIWHDLTVANCMLCMPSVIVGTLLNVLDGLSYGMILFPIGTPVFAGLESAGLSLFYVSTIVSQLVFSLGGSKFKACVGSEMIEIVPFFHSIANTIAFSVGNHDPEAVLATTITAYALSSIITGIVFFILGYLKLGTLVGFFPRHILVGCIGGVGWFLVATAVEVAARLSDPLEYNLGMLEYLMQPEILAKWGSALALSVLLLVAERRVHSPLVVPVLLILTFCAFYVVVSLIPFWNIDQVRNAGWIFPVQNAGEPWYFFYTLYRFDKVHWAQILQTVPAMLALTFFGLIHVPINIPALAAATKDDNVNVNQELIAHGISNTLSGMIGSIQNYLVYTNSVLFIKSGADSKLAGIFLALTTFFVMLAGPVIIGYIPIIVVASLMFMMGFDLIAEALVDTLGKVAKLEYLTIMVIVLTMGLYDFVVGILVGIILACFSFVITSARNSPVRATFTGQTARSTVNRHPALQDFLSRVGSQVYILKLHSSLFFGTNSKIEKGVRTVIDEPGNQIRYFIIDLGHVTDMDFCSADTFSRIKRLLDAKGIHMVLCGAQQTGDKISGLRAVDLVRAGGAAYSHQAHLFPDLNNALEYCETEFLAEYYRHRDQFIFKRHSYASIRSHMDHHGTSTQTGLAALAAPRPDGRRQSDSYGTYGVTPRATYLRSAAQDAVDEDLKAMSRWHRFQQPMPLLMLIVEGISNRDGDFWFKVVPFLKKRELKSGSILRRYETNDAGFYLVESGILRVEYPDTPGLYETILAGTAFGDFNFRTSGLTTDKVVVEADVVVWEMNEEGFKSLQTSPQGPEIATELLQVALYLSRVRFNTMISYLNVLAA